MLWVLKIRFLAIPIFELAKNCSKKDDLVENAVFFVTKMVVLKS